MRTINTLTYSTGKDSTAMLLDAMERNIDVLPFFCDTGHEHSLTYEYLNYIDKTVKPIRTIKADFSAQIAHKREYIVKYWPNKLTLDVPGHWYTEEEESEAAPDWEPEDKSLEGIASGSWIWLPAQKGLTDNQATEVVDNALSVLYPTGNPFLDLCLWKGRFPSTKRRFCTVFLKVIPALEQIYDPLMNEGNKVISWQGVRAQESKARSKLTEWEETPEGYTIYRPILKWTVEDVFAIHRKHGIEPHPLYKLGMGRVGCMPCINCGKQELFEIARRFPEEIARVAKWEELVKLASKRQASSFFPTANNTGDNIHEVVEWSKTIRGGRQYDMFKLSEEVPTCSSQYGLCE